MKTLLLHLPAGPDLRAEDRSESLGLGYIAAVLRNDGLEVEVLDAQLQLLDVKQTIEALLERSFDCLGITAMNPDRELLIDISKAVRKRRKDAVIVAGGYYPTLDTERFLARCPEVDVVVRGEGDASAADLFRRIARGEDWRDVAGVAYLRDRKPVLNPLPKLIADLDSLPFPARDALTQGPPSKWASIASSRGCFHSCSFCSVNTFYSLSGGHAPRFRSPVRVVDEMESIISSLGITHFCMTDDDFIGPGKASAHARNVAEEIIARKLKIVMSIECRADEVDEDLLKLLIEAGLQSIFLGIESGVQRQLDTYNKRTTVEQNAKAIETVRRLGLFMQPGFIPFDPYTTLEELQDNMQFAKDVDLWQGKAGPTPVKVILYPGVPLLEKVRKDGLLRDNGRDYNWVFKDKRVGLLWKGFGAVAKTSGILKRLRGRRDVKNAAEAEHE